MKIIEESARKRFNEIVLGATRKAQEKYGFNMTDKDGNYSTWNNEADAFKHAYLSWLLSWYQGDKKSKELGDMHEDETHLPMSATWIYGTMLSGGKLLMR